MRTQDAADIRLGIQIARHDIARIRGRRPAVAPSFPAAQLLVVRAYTRALKSYTLREFERSAGIS